jgi:four helix bundle protein
MKDFKTLLVWQKRYQLALSAYRATARFPREELFGLTGQIRRVSVSVPANIAEGCCRDGDAESARFLHIAMGSASELECHLPLARDLEYLSGETASALERDVSEVKRMLAALLSKLKADR